MKNLLFATMLLCVSFACTAQNLSIQSFFDKYEKLEDATVIEISSWPLRMAAKYADDEDGKKILEGLNKLHILAMDGENRIDQKEFKQLVKNIRADDFEELMQIRDGKTTVDFLIKENQKKVTNVVILVNDVEDFFLLNLECNLDFDQLNDINIDVHGSDFFKKIPEQKGGSPRA